MLREQILTWTMSEFSEKSDGAKRADKRGILRLDITKPRNSSGSVEFRNQPELISEVNTKHLDVAISIGLYPMDMPLDINQWTKNRRSKTITNAFMVNERLSLSKIYDLMARPNVMQCHKHVRTTKKRR